MINRMSKKTGSFIIILAWIVVWTLMEVKNVALALSGKGIAQIGNEYYRFFTAGLTHKNLIHLIVNVCAMFWIGYLYEERTGSVRFVLLGIALSLIHI